METEPLLMGYIGLFRTHGDDPKMTCGGLLYPTASAAAAAIQDDLDCAFGENIPDLKFEYCEDEECFIAVVDVQVWYLMPVYTLASARDRLIRRAAALVRRAYGCPQEIAEADVARVVAASEHLDDGLPSVEQRLESEFGIDLRGTQP